MDIFQALSDPVRREILGMLASREMSAGEIAERFDISRPAVSRHLRVLRESGLVLDEIRGRHRLYRFDAEGLAPVERWTAGLKGSRWSDAFDALETEVYRTRRERRESPAASDRRSA